MTKGEELLQRFLDGGMTVEQIFEFEKEIDDFFKSDAPENEKEMLGGYMESFQMVCSGLRKLQAEGRIKEGILN